MSPHRTGSGRFVPIPLYILALLILGLVAWALRDVSTASDSADAADEALAGPTAPWDVSGASGIESRIEGDSRSSRVTLKAGDHAACSKRIDFSRGGRAIVCRFNVSVESDDSGAALTELFRVGSGFNGSTGGEASARTYARLGLSRAESRTSFRLRDLVSNRWSPAFQGTQAITWVLNPSGQALSYAAPDGTVEPIAGDRMDVWVGRQHVFDDAAITNPGVSISDLSWSWNEGSGITHFGQLEASALAPVEAAAATPAEAAPVESPGKPAVELYRPWPNPSDSKVRYAYEIPSGSARVEVGVFDVAGRQIRSLVRGTQSTGRYEVIWDGRNDQGARVKGAVYFLRASVGPTSRVSRLVFLN